MVFIDEPAYSKWNTKYIWKTNIEYRPQIIQEIDLSG